MSETTSASLVNNVVKMTICPIALASSNTFHTIRTLHTTLAIDAAMALGRMGDVDVGRSGGGGFGGGVATAAVAVVTVSGGGGCCGGRGRRGGCRRG